MNQIFLKIKTGAIIKKNERVSHRLESSSEAGTAGLPALPALGRERQEDPELRLLLRHTATLRAVYTFTFLRWAVFLCLMT